VKRVEGKSSPVSIGYHRVGLVKPSFGRQEASGIIPPIYFGMLPVNLGWS